MIDERHLARRNRGARRRLHAGTYRHEQEIVRVGRPAQPVRRDGGGEEQLKRRVAIGGDAAIDEHEVLQKVLQTEPERLLPTLTLEGDRIQPLIATFLTPYLAQSPRLRPGLDPAAAADYVSRMLMSWIVSPGRWDLTDRSQVRTLVETEFLAGILV